MLQRGERGNHQIGALHCLHRPEVVHEAHGLNGLSQPHLVRQNDVSPLIESSQHEIESLYLVAPESFVVPEQGLVADVVLRPLPPLPGLEHEIVHVLKFLLFARRFALELDQLVVVVLSI